MEESMGILRIVGEVMKSDLASWVSHPAGGLRSKLDPDGRQ
jgi:hypothetical protein